MSLYNPEIHHRRSIRLKGYDYSRPGYYFITLNLENIRCMFAGWKNGKLHLTQVGKIAQQYWHEIPEHYPNVSIDEFVMMSDHFHGILIISDTNNAVINNGESTVLTQKSKSNEDSYNKVLNVEAQNRGDIVEVKNEEKIVGARNAGNNVGAQNFVPLQYKKTPQQYNIQQQVSLKPGYKQTKTTRKQEFQKIIPKSIGSIIRAYKSAVTLWCKRNGHEQFKWQRNYYEHIIRNKDELNKIRWYIRNNPDELRTRYPGL